MDESIKLSLSAENYLSLANKCKNEITNEKRLYYIHKALEANPNNIYAHLELANCYSNMGEIYLSNYELYNVYFRANELGEEDVYKLYYLLGNNALALGNIVAAEKYAREIGGEFSIEEAHSKQKKGKQKKPLRLIYPEGTKEHEEQILKEAYEYLYNDKIEECIETLSQISEKYPDIAEAARGIIVASHFYKGDLDGTIEIAERYIKEHKKGQYLLPLIDAYLTEGKKEEALKYFDELIKLCAHRNFYELLVFALRSEDDVTILKSTEAVLSNNAEITQSIRLLYAVSLWNVGRKEDAKRQFGIIENQLGPNFPKKYYYTMMEDNLKIPYPKIGSMSILPIEVEIKCAQDVLYRIGVEGKNLANVLEYDEDFVEQIKYVISNGPREYCLDLAKALGKNPSRGVIELCKYALMRDYTMSDETQRQYLLTLMFALDSFEIPIDLDGCLGRVFYSFDSDILHIASVNFIDGFFSAIEKAAQFVGQIDTYKYTKALCTLVIPFFFEADSESIKWRQDRNPSILKARSVHGLASVFLYMADRFMNGINNMENEDYYLAFDDVKKDTYKKYIKMIFPDDEV